VQLVGVQSGLALNGDTDLTIETDATTPEAARAQAWTVRTIDGAGTNRHRFTLQNGDGLFLGERDGATALIDTDAASAAGDAATQWMGSTLDGTTYSVLNVAAERVLDVDGAGSDAGTAVGLWTSNGAGNQAWRLVGTAAVGSDPVSVATAVGRAPELPETVTVRYAGDVGRAAPVTWNTDGLDFGTAGTVTVPGTAADVFGASVEARAEVEVGAFTATRPRSVTVRAGSTLAAVQAQADDTVLAELRPSGPGYAVPVSWEWTGVDDAAFAAPGTVEVAGATEDGLVARLTVIVTAAVPRNVAPESTPSATYTESGYGVERTINGDTTDKGWSNWRSDAKNPSDTLGYALAAEETVRGVAVQFFRDGGPSWADSLRVDHRLDGGAWVEGEPVAVPVPAQGAPRVEVPIDGARADEVRVVLTAPEDQHMIVSEVEILADTAGPSGVADLARLTVGDAPVAGFAAATTEYAVTVEGDTLPQLFALAVDEDAVVQITQPQDAAGTGSVQVTAADGSARTYTVAVTLAEPGQPGQPGEPGEPSEPGDPGTPGPPSGGDSDPGQPHGRDDLASTGQDTTGAAVTVGAALLLLALGAGALLVRRRRSRA